MRKRWITRLLVSIVALMILAACGTSSPSVALVHQTAVSSTAGVDTAASSSAVGTTTVATAAAENSADHDDADDYIWDEASVIQITLSGDTISAAGDGVKVDGSTATITTAGTYMLSGTLADGQIIVDTTDDAIVRLILNGVDLHSSTSAPIYVAKAEKTMIMLAENSENRISDGATYVFASQDEDEPNAALFSKSDLTIAGSGSLIVTGSYNDGIASKDGLIIAGGTISVSAVDDGIRGKDYLVVKDGTVTVNARGNGLKSDNEEDATLGYITVEAGAINVTSGGDSIQAASDVLIASGDIHLSAGGGSSATIDESVSAKGIKGALLVTIDGGAFTIDTADDAIHSNADIVVNNGAFNITSGDDGIHADSSLTINDGDIQISQSYEGIESAIITVNAGNISIVAGDDGINVAGGADGSGMNGGPGGPPPGPGGDSFATSGDYFLYINGGYIVVDAAGDGIDIGGSIVMTDGVVIVNGPTENMNGALDYDGSFSISGGFMVAAGSAGMAEAPDTTSTQYSVLINTDTAQSAGTLVHIQSSDGESILTFAPTKRYQSIAFSSPELLSGTTYKVSFGGSATGSVQDGLYQDGTYSAGTSYTSFTTSDVVTTVGNTMNRFR